MTNLEQLMRDTVGTPPEDNLDMGALLVGGQRRVRGRRMTRLVASSGVVLTATLLVGVLVPRDTGQVTRPAGVPVPAGLVLHLDQAESAVAGRDYALVVARDVPSYYSQVDGIISGVTDDGLLVLEQSPGGMDQGVVLTLLDPASGDEDPLPRAPDLDPLTRPRALDLGLDRFVYWVSPRDGIGDAKGDGSPVAPAAQVFDRATQRWTTVMWPGLPALTGRDGSRAVLGPDDRIYFSINPSDTVMSDEFGDESGATGVSYALWSMSLTDPTDVRDEGMRVGQIDFTSTEMVWTDRDNGDGGLVHVRDLASGDERSFDPQSGARCNLLGMSVSEDDVVLNQYCGTYPGEVRDDRIQVVTTTGDPVVTIQGDGVSGGIAQQQGPGDIITINNYGGAELDGTYAYDLESARLLRLSDRDSIFAVGGPTPLSYLMWTTPLGEAQGAGQVGLKQHVGRLLR